MTAPHGGSAHAGLRGGAVGATVATLAVAAHGIAGGGYPDSAEGALVLLLATVAGTAAAARPIGRGRLGMFGVLAAGQLICHVALSGLIGHGHAAPTGHLPGGWMLAIHGIATLACGALILLAQRLCDVASAVVLAALTRPRSHPVHAFAGRAETGLSPYRFHPNSAIGPRAPPVPA
ncbi:hypothetical protein [Nocardia sp. NPDC050710]|uniref:hypothetical protein n=1 Tax=Nocardia sp. NPDC050710 TaxID=3157220 RepID=UPI0033F0183C